MTADNEVKQRKIIHVDMDAFYASVEQRDHPEWRGKPIAVGGGSKRGVITTASYEARKFGIKSAMPGFKARLLCPDLIFTPVRFDAYKEASHQIRAVFARYTDLIEPLSFDEAFLDVTENKIKEPIATEIAKKIKHDIFQETELSSTAGVSYCKFLAKVASNMNKPDGLTVIRPHQAEAFLETLPIESFFGIGKVTALKMRSMGIQTGKDIKALDRLTLSQRFGKMGSFYYDIVRGIDNRPVRSKRVRKSLAVERTMSTDILSIEEMRKQMEAIIDKFFDRVLKSKTYGKTITLKVKTSEFKILTRSRSFDHQIKTREQISAVAYQLIEDHFYTFGPIRLIGLTMSNFPQTDNARDAQLRLDI